MATSGTINGTNYTSYNHHLYLTWTQTKNVSGNYSTFAFKLYCYKGTNWDSNYKKSGTLTVAGTTYTFSYNPSGQGNQLLYSGSKTIYHNSSGNASVSVSASWIVEMNLSNTYYYEFKLSGTATLDTIYRGTTISSFSYVSSDWRSLTFSFATKDTATISYCLNGGSTWTSVGSSISSGTFTISSLTPNTSYKVQIKAVRNSVTVYSSTLTYKTLAGCTAFFVNTVDLTNWKIVTNITNENSANIKLFLDIKCPDSYGGSSVNHSDVLTKEIGAVNGNYTWTFTDAEKTTILNQLKYTANGTGTLYAKSYVPSDTISSSNHISSSGKSISFTLSESTYKPTISDTSLKRDTKTSDLISEDTYLIQGVSSPTVSLTTNNVSLTTGAVLQQITWIFKTPSGTNPTIENYSSQTTFSKTWSASDFPNSGSYTISVTATDTRGLTSDAKSYTFTVLPYHKPIISAEIVRALNSGGVTAIDYLASYSRLVVSSSDMNSIKAIKYGYKIITDNSDPTASTELTSYTTTDASNTVDKELSLSNSEWITLDPESNYRFVFVLQDAISTTTTYVDLVDGKPIMRMLNNGQISINTVPDTTDTDTMFFVGGNIKVSDDINVGGNINVSNAIYEGSSALEDKYRRYNVLAANASGGTTGYVHIAQIVVNQTHANQPLEIKLFQRGYKICSTLFIRFTNSGDTDPTLAYFRVDGTATAYIYKSATSTWDIYVLKSEAYDCIDIVDYTIPSYMSSRVNLIWKNTLASTVPDGSTKATYIDVVANTLTVSGNESVGGTLSVTGKVTASGGISVTGDLVVNETNVEDSIDELRTDLDAHINEAKARVITGNVVKTNGGYDYVKLHTWSEISALFTAKYGSAPSGKESIGVSVTNGDGNAIGELGMYAEWWSGSTLWVYFNKTFTGDVRIFYCYTAYY